MPKSEFLSNLQQDCSEQNLEEVQPLPPLYIHAYTPGHTRIHIKNIYYAHICAGKHLHAHICMQELAQTPHTHTHTGEPAHTPHIHTQERVHTPHTHRRARTHTTYTQESVLTHYTHTRECAHTTHTYTRECAQI